MMIASSSKIPRRAAAALAVLLAAAAPGAEVGTGADEPARVRIPVDEPGPEILEQRRQAQLRGRSTLMAPADFGFADRVADSGIDFVHESVDDALKTWKPVHYDHGNGVAVADVDGDGRLDLYFTTQLGGNRLYRNLGGGKFEDVTEAAGVALDDRIGVTASFADFDNDGDPDLFTTSVRGGNALFENDGNGRFTDVTQRAGVGYSGHSSGAVFFDYDGDGRLDLFVTNVGVYTTDELGRGGFYLGIDAAFEGHNFPDRTETSVLYRNLGDGRFEDVSKKTGLVDTAWSGDATFTDFDRDRDPDLYVLNMQGDDHYWENVDGERFVERTAELFAKTPWGAMGVKFFDYNNDGRLDLVVTDMHSDMHDQPVDPLRDEKRKYDLQGDDGENNIWGNALYEQQRDGSFLEISDLAGAENYWPWGLSAGDFNADGWEDLFVSSSMNYPFRYGINSLLLNDGGLGFRDAEFILGVEPRAGGRTHKEVFELDCSGADAEHTLCHERQGRLVVEGALGTRASVILDLEDDGDLDVVTLEFNDRPQVLVSDLAQRGEIRWVKVALEGTSSNRDGLGARVTVVAGGRSHVRYHDGKSGYLVQSSQPLYFGLGGADRIDRIEVAWPSGKDTVVTEGLAINSLIEIREEPEPASE